MRKIVQIYPIISYTFWSNNYIIYVLCDDGTVWAKQPWVKGDTWDEIDTSEITKNF